MKKFTLVVVLLFTLLSGTTINAANLKLESQHVYMYDLDTQEVLLNIKSNEKIYPASLTKMMTLLVAIEQSSDINEKVTITDEMLAGLKKANASMAGFRTGDKVTIEDLLYGVNLPSGADSSNALAIHLSGSLNKFVALMNQKAKKIGMNNTHFVNVTGLHHSNHYSTLHDLSKLVSYAIKNELWYKVTTTKNHKTKSLASHPDGLLLESTFYRYINNTVKKSQYDVTIPGFLGGKSGFTDEARYNLASFARYPGGTYVLLTAKAGNSYYRPSHVLDAEKIYRHYFQNFHKKLFVGKEQVVAELPIKYNYFRSKVALVTKEDISSVVNRSAIQQVHLEIPEKLEAPVSSSKAIGKLNIVENNKVIHQVAIYPATSVSKHHTLYLFTKVFSWIKHNWVLILSIVVVVKLLSFRKRKRKYRKKFIIESKLK